MEFEKEAKFQVNLESQLNFEFSYDNLEMRRVVLLRTV